MKLIYRLSDRGEPVPVEDDAVLDWAAWFEKDDNRVVAVTRLSASGQVRARVSTVFLGIVPGWAADGSPILWETAIFTPATDASPPRASDVLIAGRYTTREAALAGHHAVIAELEAASTEKLDRTDLTAGES